MILYMHVDGLGELKSGDIINLQKRPNESPITQYAGLFEPDFASHIESLCAEGLSYHGYRHLIKHLEHGAVFRTDLILNELHLEYVRWKMKAVAPSRYKSFFAWANLEDAISFAEENHAKPRILSVYTDGEVFKADMNLARSKHRADAEKYWNGNRASNTASYNPRWEYLLQYPVRIVEEVEI